MRDTESGSSRSNRGGKYTKRKDDRNTRDKMSRCRRDIVYGERWRAISKIGFNPIIDEPI
jgi:hypothetical protein